MVGGLIHEAQTLGLAVHVHSPAYTLAPDWVELAAFLLAANDRSWFSYSRGDWMFDSFPAMPEYGRPLGLPLGPPSNASSPSKPYAAWALIPGVNFIFSLPPAPNASVPGVLQYLGGAASASAEACLTAVRAGAGGHSNYTALTWVDPSRHPWGPACFARMDAFPAVAAQCLAQWDQAAPCYTAAEATCTSAVAVPVSVPAAGVVWTREFQHLTVTLDTATLNATLAWH